MNWKVFFIFLLFGVFLVQVQPQLVVAETIVDECFPTLAEAGLWYNYTSSGNRSGSLVIITKNEYVRVESLTITNNVFSARVVVQTESFENGTLTYNGSVTFNINIPLDEVPSTHEVLWFFFNAKRTYEAVKRYVRGLGGLLGNFSLKVYYDNYTYNGVVRTVVVGQINGTNVAEYVYAKYVVDNETGVLLEKTYFRYRYASVKARLVEAEKTVLRETNFKPLLPPTAVEIHVTKLLYLLLVAVVVAIAVSAWWKWKRKSGVLHLLTFLYCCSDIG